jgi:two-component system cell cycle sensor histidine kinase/response regulator CckA
VLRNEETIASSDGASEPRLVQAAPSSRGGSGRPERLQTILLADDHDGVRALLVAVLERAGYEVVEARDGRQALDLFEASPDGFLAVVLDMVMPRLTGDEVYRAVRAMRPHLGVIFASSFGGDVVAPEVARDGVATFIEKPFADEQLPAAITAVTRTATAL